MPKNKSVHVFKKAFKNSTKKKIDKKRKFNSILHPSNVNRKKGNKKKNVGNKTQSIIVIFQ